MDVKKFRDLVGGQFFTVTFEKKDGTTRTLNGRLGVSKYVSGKGLAFDPESRGMIVVFDPHAVGKKGKNDKGYRMVTLDRVKELKCGGQTYTF